MVVDEHEEGEKEEETEPIKCCENAAISDTLNLILNHPFFSLS